MAAAAMPPPNGIKIVNRNRLVPLLVLLMQGGASGCNSPEPPANTGVDLGHLLAGNTLVGAEDAGVGWAVFYTADGAEFGRYGDDTDTGRWRVDGDNLCSDWQTWGDEERCFRIRRNADGLFLGYSGETLEWQARLEQGDTLGLSTPASR